MEPLLVYFSSKSENTHRFIERVGLPSQRISLSARMPALTVAQPYILVCPTYAGDDGSGAVPKQVIRFLNDVQNRQLLKGVIASGNRNFGRFFAYAGTVISQKCSVPFLYKFELMGTAEDVQQVRQGVQRFWRSLNLSQRKECSQ